MIPKLSTAVEAEVIGDEMVIYNASTEAAVHLNQSGAVIYQLIDGTRTSAEIVQLLAEAFPEAEVERDVMALFAQLQEAKIISYS